MFVRLLIALLASPWYGFLAVLASLPIVVLGSVGLGLIISGIRVKTGAAATLSDVVLLIIIASLIGIAALLLAIATIVQMARYAASFTGTIRLREQPSFLRSYLRGLLVLLLVWLFFGVLSVVVFAIIGSIFGPSGAWGVEYLIEQAWLKPLTEFALTGQATPALERQIMWAALIVRIMNLIYAALLAMILVPYACGIHATSGASWTGPMVLVRTVVAVPCVALMTAIIAELLIQGVELGIGAAHPGLRLIAALAIENIVALGVFFAFEAMLLRGEREVSHEDYQTHLLDEQHTPEEYASMLRQRMQQE